MATPRITEGMFFNTKVGFILMGGVVWVFDRLRLTKMGRDASCFSMTKIGGRSLGRCFLRQHDKGGGTKFGGLRQAQTDMIDGRECVDASCVSMIKFGGQRWGSSTGSDWHDRWTRMCRCFLRQHDKVWVTKMGESWRKKRLKGRFFDFMLVV